MLICRKSVGVMEKIKKAYEYYLKIKDLNKGDTKVKNLKNKDRKEYMYSPYFYPHRALFSFIVDEYGFNKNPQIIPSIKYFVCEGNRVYHGFKEFDHGAEFLVDQNYHKGVGYTCGMYFTNDEYEADNYTAKFINSDDYEIDAFKTIECKIGSHNSVSYDNLCKLRDAILSNQLSSIENEKDLNKINDILSKIKALGDDENVVGFLKCILKNPSTLAVLMNYDYIIDGLHLIMLNRNIMIVSDVEFNRFCTRSRFHRGITADSFINIEKC